MSWSISFQTPSKVAAQAELRKHKAALPDAIVEALYACVDAVPEGLGVSVYCSGHLGEYLTTSISVGSITPEVIPHGI